MSDVLSTLLSRDEFLEFRHGEFSEFRNETRERFVRIETRLDSMATRDDLAGVKSEVNNLAVRLDSMATRDDLAGVESEVNNLAVRLDNMATRDDLAGVESEVNNLAVRLDNMATRDDLNKMFIRLLVLMPLFSIAIVGALFSLLP